MSLRTFARRFRQRTGATPGWWVNQQRVLLAARLLERGNDTIAAVSVRSGFGSPDTLRRHFIHARGVTPSQYRRAFRLTEPGTSTPDLPVIDQDTTAAPALTDPESPGLNQLRGHRPGQHEQSGPAPQQWARRPYITTQDSASVAEPNLVPSRQVVLALEHLQRSVTFAGYGAREIPAVMRASRVSRCVVDGVQK
jgi:hypothetical protein